MFFTQEDYRKIEAYLKSKAVRDTSFDSATTPLQGNETIVLVQGGKNVNTTVSDIVSQFFALGVSDFINVTDKYGISYNTLDEAIRVIPWRSRKVGQVITFLNEQGEWHLYQYQGESILTWNNTTLWVDLLESRIVNSILPDQEDLTMTEPDADGNSYMHFKDKDYSIDDFSGLGRVYLRKNLQTLTDPNTGETRLINYLTQTMVGKENVIYHIQYDYNLNGQTIIIPEGCVLLFEGGSISNGTINGNNTVIEADSNAIIFDSVVIEGTWNVEHIYDSWFAFNTSPSYISNQIITNILALSNDNVYNTIHFDADRTYYFELPYKGKANLGDDVRPDYWKLNTEEYSFLRIFTNFTSNTHLIVNNTIQMLPTNQGAYFIFHIEGKSNIEISGTGVINADAKDHLYTDPFAGANYYGEWGHIFNFRSCDNIVIRDITVGYAFGDALAFSNIAYNNNGTKAAGPATKNVLIDGVKVLYARRNGIALGGNNYTITNVYFEGCGSDEIKGTAPMAGIDFENDYTEVEPSGVCSNVSMSSCKFKNNKYDVSSTIRDDLGPVPRGQLVTISDCNFTSPLRLNRTNGLTFNNCHIVGISNHDNSISPWFASKDLVFNSCIFDELNPYLAISAEEQNKKFINPTYPEDIKYSTAFQQSLAAGRALKFTIPKPLVGLVEFTAFCSNPNYDAVQMPINITEYSFGNSQRLTGIRDIKVKAAQDNTLRYASYRNTPVFSYINYAEDADNFNIYFAIGGDLISNPLGGNTSVNIFLTSKTKFIVVEAPVSKTPGIAGMYGGKWSTLSAITKSVIDVTAIPSSVTFPSKEMFPANMLADLPTSLTSDKVGFSQYVLDNSYKCPVFWDSFSSVFRTADGNRALVRSVTSSDALNTLTDQMTIDDRGYVVYTTVNNSYLTWNGYDWVNEDGSLFTKVKYVKRTVDITTLNNIFSYSNVVYKIVGDIDLAEGTLTIATGSTLDFQGGSFSNGTIVGNNTKIKAGIEKIFDNITINGTWNNNNSYLEWFNLVNSKYPINEALKLSNNLRLLKNTYSVTTISIPESVCIQGESTTESIINIDSTIDIDNNNIILKTFSINPSDTFVGDSLIKVHSSYYCVFEKLNMGSTKVDAAIIFDGTDSSYYHVVTNCNISSFNVGIKFMGHANANSVLYNNFYLVKTNIVIDSCNGLRIIGNTFQDFKTKGIDILYSTGSRPVGNSINSNYFEGDKTVAICDIDFNNTAEAVDNMIIGNHHTFMASDKPHILNIAGPNTIIDSTRSTIRNKSYIAGIPTLEIIEKQYINALGADYLISSISPIKIDDENIEWWACVQKAGVRSLEKIFTFDDSKDWVQLDKGLIVPFITQYYGQGITLGYDANLSDRKLTFDNQRRLLKYGYNDKWNYVSTLLSGTTSERPSADLNMPVGLQYFDTTLVKPIYWTGTSWVDSTGTAV